MHVQTTIEGAVATVMLNRPERMNALTKEMREELIEAFQSLRFNNDVRAVILTGAGTNFCAGADIDRMAEQDLRDRRDRLQGLSQTYMRILHALEKPVICAVRGHAVGIGMSLVKRFCDRFGWRIDLASTPDQGTVATVLIPEASYSELT